MKPEAGVLRAGSGDSPAHRKSPFTIPPSIWHLTATREKNRAEVSAVLQGNGSRKPDRYVAPRPGEGRRSFQDSPERPAPAPKPVGESAWSPDKRHEPSACQGHPAAVAGF